jgi:probable phosphoglycerate mutase
MVEITFIRHAETDANVAHVWQGQGDAPLTNLGRRQAADLGRRLRAHAYDAVIASDLGRVLETADAAGLEPISDPAWREIDIGGWEGLTRDEVLADHRDDLEALGRGEDVSLGGGETWRRFGARVDAAVRGLLEQYDDGDRVLVLTHGGTIHSTIAGVLGIRARGRPWPIDRVENTALTVLVAEDQGPRIICFNDTAHTSTTPHPLFSGPLVSLIRHAETAANVDGRYQGIGEGALTRNGVGQARRLAGWFDGASHIATSPRKRAQATAGALGSAAGIDPVIRHDLVEMDFGAWEDLTPAQIAERHPDEWRAVMFEGHDVPRGGDGETFASAGARLSLVVDDVGSATDRVALVTHGAIIRAYAGRVLSLPFADRGRLGLPRNASVTGVRLGSDGPSLSSYGVVGF